MVKKYLVKRKNVKILALKKDTYAATIAKNSDVLKAIIKSNKKHYKLMSKLAE